MQQCTVFGLGERFVEGVKQPDDLLARLGNDLGLALAVGSVGVEHHVAQRNGDDVDLCREIGGRHDAGEMVGDHGFEVCTHAAHAHKAHDHRGHQQDTDHAKTNGQARANAPGRKIKHGNSR